MWLPDWYKASLSKELAKNYWIKLTKSGNRRSGKSAEEVRHA